MDSGFEVQIRDARYEAARETAHEPMVIVDFNAAGKLTLEEITWATADTPR